MNREQAKALLPFIQAFSEGKTVQWLTGSGEWYDVVGKDTIDFEYLADRKTKYRIKPEPKYRPFKDATECWQEMLKHQPFGWILDRYGETYHIAKVRARSITICLAVNFKFYNYEEASEFTFADETPFGVKIEEDKQ